MSESIHLSSENACEAFVRQRGDRDLDEHWTCPECGAENFGLYYSRESACPECKGYQHPAIGARKCVEIRLRVLERESRNLHIQIHDLESSAEYVDNEIRRMQALLKLKKVSLGVRVPETLAKALGLQEGI